MASLSTITSCFYLQAKARPKTQNPKPNKSSSVQVSRNANSKGSSKLKPQQITRKSVPEQIKLTGSDATSYTRLPPREDFELPSLNFDVVKLSDAGAARPDSEGEGYSFRRDGAVVDVGNDMDGGGLRVDYGKFEVYEVNSDVEEDDYEDEDAVDEEEDYDDVSEEGKEVAFDGETANVYESDAANVYESDAANVYESDAANVYESDAANVYESDAANVYESDGFQEKFYEGEAGDFSDTEGEDVKDKGLPAVMRCFDHTKIYVKAGNGGNGVVAFRREKFVPNGGPSGGNGGRGGHVYVEVDGSMNSLLPFRNRLHYRAGRGSHGQGSAQNGARGEDVVVKVPPGTVIRESGKEEVLLELLEPGQRGLLLPGGRGGRGNAAFKSGTNRLPRIAENGEEGPEMWLELELKLVADVGIIGAPNAGKSTLLSVISAAQPAIANYPFTTLLPNLGVVSFGFDSTLVVADLPGLLEGAHRGFGLGHEFLRHTERCSALVHVVDGSSPQPDLEFDAVRLELELFNPELSEKPFVVAYNKMDLPEANENWPRFREKLQALGIEPFCMSAVQREGTHKVICAAHELLQKNKEANGGFEGWSAPVNLNRVADAVQMQRKAAINDFEIIHDSGSNKWHVEGSGLLRFVQMTNWSYKDSDKRFQHVLDACGVNKSLKKMGVKEGDTVIVGEMELVWHDSPASSGVSNMNRTSTDSIKWPDWK